MKSLSIKELEKRFFSENGYLVLEDIVEQRDVQRYKSIYQDFIDGRISVDGDRRDLKGGNQDDGKEGITQIMVPSRHLPELRNSTYYKRVSEIARQLLGPDMEIDFDMLINKPPYSDSPTPWHQDCAYWIDMPDKRAISFWMSLDEATIDNGCMWYVPKSHLKPLRKHISTAKNGALQCKCDEKEAVHVELKPGSVVMHHGATLHYSRGNTTNTHRRAMIVNLRPKDMIIYERERGFDHTGENKVRNDVNK